MKVVLFTRIDKSYYDDTIKEVVTRYNFFRWNLIT